MKKGNKLCRALIIIGAVLAVLGIAAYIVLGVVMQVTFTVDESQIKKNPDYNVATEQVNGYTTLTKRNADGSISSDDFRVIGFTDIHLDAKKEKGDFTMSCLIRNIVREKPDLVVFVGDNITAGFNRRRAKQLCEVMEKLGVYWTCVLGNHEGDNIWSMSRHGMLKLFASYPHCLVEADTKYTASGEKVWGNGNHVINFICPGGQTMESLYFIDGGSDMSEEDMERYDAEFDDKVHNYYDYVKDSQITWYKETAAKIAAASGIPVKSVVFDHIALPEYKTAYDAITGENEVTQNTPEYCVPDADGDYILTGKRREVICNSGHNSHFFDAMLEAGSQAFICGHDHINDFVLSYKGVILAYNEAGGYSSYNVVSKKLESRLIKGYTIYTFPADGSVGIEHFHNADIYPDEQAAILKLYE